MSIFKLKIKGIDDALATFSRFDKQTRVAVRDTVKKSATRIRNVERQRVRVNKGVMQKSIRVTYSSDGFSAEVGPRSSFAHLIEFGTVHSPAFPFVTPTAEEEGVKFGSEMESALKQVVRDA